MKVAVKEPSNPPNPLQRVDGTGGDGCTGCLLTIAIAVIMIWLWRVSERVAELEKRVSATTQQGKGQ